MEYGYALITPKGSNMYMDIIKQLVKEGYENNLTSLINVCNIDLSDVQFFLEKTGNKVLCEQMRRTMSTNSIIPILVRGNNACQRLKRIASKFNSYNSNFRTSKANRYMDNIYVSYNANEALEDFCEYMHVDDFAKIEDRLFDKNAIGVYSCDFCALKEEVKRIKLSNASGE